MMVDLTRRDEALEAGYDAMMETPVLADRVDFSLNEFKEKCAEFEVWGFFDKEPIGMVFFDGNHSHIAIKKKYHGKCGKMIKHVTKLALSKHGYLIADVHKNNKKAINLVERLGFILKCNKSDILTFKLGD